MFKVDSILRGAGGWFLRSGIQEPGGGVARYYRTDVGKNAQVSTEITGYAVSTLLYLAERTGDESYRESGVRAARFLTRRAWNPALATFPFEHSDNCERPKALAYFFDCGIIVRGLLAAWRSTSEQEFLDTAVAAGRSMIADFESGTAIHPILRLPDKAVVEYELRWSAMPGCYQLKAASAWHDLFAATGERCFDVAYERAVDRALCSEAEFLPGGVDREKVMDRLHAYCYFLEGLLPCAGRPDCSRTIEAGMQKTAAYLDDIAPEFARSDVYAQLLRMRLYGARFAGVFVDEGRAAFEAARVAEFQSTGKETCATRGGFMFGRRGGEMLPFVNPVSTAFCLQALALWSDYQSGTLQVDWHTLI